MSQDWPDLNYGDLNDVAGHLLRPAYVQAQKTCADTFKEEDITSLQFGAIDLILLNPGVAHKDLAAALSAAPSVLTTALKPLLAAKRISSDTYPEDRRQSAYRLTRQGETWFRPLKKKLRKADKSLIGGLSAAEATNLKAALRALIGREI